MKKVTSFSNILKESLLVCFFVCLFVCKSFSQNVSVSADKMNVFYVGVDNPVSIAATDFSCKDLSIKISNGKIYGSDCRYLVRCDSVGKCRIVVSTKKKGKHNHTWVSEFRVKMIPKPVFKIGPYGSCYSMVSKRTIQAQEYVRADLENFDFDAFYTVDSFRVRIIKDSIETASFINKGNKINDDVHDAFSILAKGDVIVFDKIITHSPLIDPSLKGFYESDSYDEYGNPVYKRNASSNEKYLKLELDQLVLKVYE